MDNTAVNEEDINDEMTPLMFAAKYNSNPEVIKILLEFGADVGIRDEYNKTAFDYFEKAEEYPEIKKLLEVKEVDVENIIEKGEDTTAVTQHKEISGEEREITKIKQIISELLHMLTPREERVLRMRFGIGMNTDHTLEEVSNQFNVTRERIRQIESKALRKLKHPLRFQKIEHLPYWGNSPEEKLLRCLHLLYSYQNRNIEQHFQIAHFYSPLLNF